uniref:Interleukin 1 receptor accessory protein n=1 Tax=Leptobrachium leishanense TaxID=445787 RepID=A0A8C5MHI4_9ANUR
MNCDTKKRCDDWGVDNMKLTQLYEGEPARISCPLFQDFLKHNYSTAHSAGLTLMWYRTSQGKDLEEPINIRLPDNRINKDKDTLWFRPALLNDTGNYTCMLRNTSFCSRVAFPLEVLRKEPGLCISPAEKIEVVEFYLDHLEILTCPDTDGFFPANITVNWYMDCNLVTGFVEREPLGLQLIFRTVRQHYEGNYTCVVTYEENGKMYTLTRTRRVKAYSSPSKSKPPSMTTPNNNTDYLVATGEDLNLPCEVYFSFIKNSHTDIWWLVDGKNAENSDPKVNVTTSVKDLRSGDKTIIKLLRIKSLTPEDLKRNYTCIASNSLGTISRQAIIKEKVGTPRYITELACGLGATVFLVVCLIVAYHVYWLEMVLFYRAHFGTDETIGDGKEYDVYVSYARNAEEEEFVLVTLRGVLENEFGYKLCIFDRDSLPGGIITDETLSFIKKSRRLLVVISPSYVLRGTQALLELKAGLENMATQGNIQLILVQFKAIKSKDRVKELKLAQKVLSVIKWKGEKSMYPGGRFWKQLHVALPVKKTCPSKESICIYTELQSL